MNKVHIEQTLFHGMFEMISLRIQTELILTIEMKDWRKGTLVLPVYEAEFVFTF